MNFNRIQGEKLIVGSHPWNAADIVDLYDYNGVKAIENLQQSGESDRGDIDAITVECARLDIWYQRVPIQDRSEKSVRANLRKAVGILDRAITKKAKNPDDTVYLHCCKGLGRSPSVAAAYLYWFSKKDMTLDDACGILRRDREHSDPYKKAIGEATQDFLKLKDGQGKYQLLPPEYFWKISSHEKDTIQEYVRENLPPDLNA